MFISYSSFDVKPKCLQCRANTSELALLCQYFGGGQLLDALP